MRMKETRVWMEEGIEGKQKEMREKPVGKKVNSEGNRRKQAEVSQGRSRREVEKSDHATRRGLIDVSRSVQGRCGSEQDQRLGTKTFGQHEQDTRHLLVFIQASHEATWLYTLENN